MTVNVLEKKQQNKFFITNIEQLANKLNKVSDLPTMQSLLAIRRLLYNKMLKLKTIIKL